MTALELIFDGDIDDDAFSFEPPPDFKYVEEQPDGSWEILHDPAVPEEAPADPSARQVRIQQRFGLAQSPGRWPWVLGLSGSLLILGGVLLRLRR
ncbi:MAG: hypothetical protein DYG91_14240 [Chloroflexi bacterium CFX7]|nr:hypothetical protein [Chloroflexi bacterium CFX7]